MENVIMRRAKQTSEEKNQKEKPARKKTQRKRFRKFWKLGKDEFNTQFFSISKDNELVVHEGNYQYNIFDLVQKFGSPLEIAFPFIVEKRYLDLVQTFNFHIKEDRKSVV